MRRPTRRLGITLVRAYQLVMAPFTGGACRFEPSCSAYAALAIEEHGLLRGLWLALRRVSRCHPLGSAGYDPVPPRAQDEVPRIFWASELHERPPSSAKRTSARPRRSLAEAGACQGVRGDEVPRIF